MFWLSLAILAVFFVGLVLGHRHLSRRVLIWIGIGFAVNGLIPLAVLEWSYSSGKTTPVTIPVTLDRASVVRAAPFTIEHPGLYNVWLVFDHADDTADFDCWVGYHAMESSCPLGDPALDVGWRLLENGAFADLGGTDWRTWRSRQRAIGQAAMAHDRRTFLAYQARTFDPSNRWPLYADMGHFWAQPGVRYDFELEVRKPAGPLARLHPRLVIGLSDTATKGLGVLVTIATLLWVLAGAVLVLIALKRTQKP